MDLRVYRIVDRTNKILLELYGRITEWRIMDIRSVIIGVYVPLDKYEELPVTAINQANFTPVNCEIIRSCNLGGWAFSMA